VMGKPRRVVTGPAPRGTRRLDCGTGKPLLLLRLLLLRLTGPRPGNTPVTGTLETPRAGRTAPRPGNTPVTGTFETPC